MIASMALGARMSRILPLTFLAFGLAGLLLGARWPNLRSSAASLLVAASFVAGWLSRMVVIDLLDVFTALGVQRFANFVARAAVMIVTACLLIFLIGPEW
jgi:hypothetical protein